MQSDIKNDASERGPIRPGLIVIGCAGVAIACGAVSIEAWRNFWFGMQDGIVYALAYLLFAVGLIVAQAFGHHLGWLRVLPALLFCAGITVWAGLGFYSGRIERSVRDSAAHAEAVGRARKDAAEADERVSELQARLTLITEMATSASLRRAQQDAEARAKAEASRERGGCGVKADSLCKVAEKEAAEFGRRAIQAEARELAETQLAEARRRRDEARARADAEAPRNAGGAAFVVAWATGGDEGAMRRYAGAGEPMAIIAGQLILAGFFAPGLWLIRLGSGRGAAPRPMPAPERVEEIAPRAPRRRKVEAKAEAVADEPEQPQPAATVSERIASVVRKPAAPQPAPRLPAPADPAEGATRFVAERLEASEAASPFAEIKDAFAHWWRANYRDSDAPQDKVLVAAMRAAGISEKRTNKGKVYGAAISKRPMVAAVHGARGGV